MINAKTKLFAILGCPVKHSFSPIMQNMWFEKEKLNCAYLAFEPQEYELAIYIKSLRELNFKGFNITVPHKISALKYVDILDKASTVIGGINTVVNKTNKLYGYNTDYLGFAKDLETKKIIVKGKNVLVVGAAGAARAIIYALKIGKANNIYITNRTLDKAINLAKEFRVKSLALDDVASVLSNTGLLVNCSSCGMKTNDKLPFDFNTLNPKLVVYDIIYNKETPFVKFAKSNRLEFFTGGDMLIWQGAYAFKIWTGRFPDIKIAKGLLRDFLKRGK